MPPPPPKSAPPPELVAASKKKKIDRATRGRSRSPIRGKSSRGASIERKEEVKGGREEVREKEEKKVDGKAEVQTGGPGKGRGEGSSAARDNRGGRGGGKGRGSGGGLKKPPPPPVGALSAVKGRGKGKGEGKGQGKGGRGTGRNDAEQKAHRMEQVKALEDKLEKEGLLDSGDEEDLQRYKRHVAVLEAHMVGKAGRPRKAPPKSIMKRAPPQG